MKIANICLIYGKKGLLDIIRKIFSKTIAGFVALLICGSAFLGQFQKAEPAPITMEAVNETVKASDVYFDEVVSASRIVYKDKADNWGITKMNFESFRQFLDKYEADKQEVIVAVIDTGLNEDADSVFDKRIVKGASFLVENKSTLSDNFRVLYENNAKKQNNSQAYMDDNGHGTAVCGIIAQATDETVKIMPIKCLDENGVGNELSVYKGIIYALNNGADVINLSCCSDGDSYFYEEALKLAYNQNVPVVVASGNESVDVANVTPANISSAITVSSIDVNNKFSYFSNYGKYIDFVAAGEDVSITYYKGGSVRSSGTSFSAPLITAAVASLLECNPDFTCDEIEQLLKDNAVDLGEEGWDEYYGYGYVDMQLLEDDMLRYIVDANSDVNADGVVDVNDVLLVLKTAAKEAQMDELQRARIAVYGDSEVTVSNALAVMRIVVGIDSK